MNQEALNIAVKAVQIYAATHPGIASAPGRLKSWCGLIVAHHLIATLFASTATNHLHLSLRFPAWKQEGYRRLRRSLLPC